MTAPIHALTLSQADCANYAMPPDGWVCYHCGERFTTPGAAGDHFGVRPGDGLACRIKAGEQRGLVMALRKAQAEHHEARCLVAKLIAEATT